MICEAPIRKGPDKGLPATGTQAGYFRHYRAKEPACSACAEGERIRARRQRATNPEKAREQSREDARRWRKANLEAKRELDRRWYAANPERGRERDRRRRARKAGALNVPFTPKQLGEKVAFWGYRCWMCSGPYEAVDHVIALARGGPHCLSNLRPACRSCNASKGAKRVAA